MSFMDKVKFWKKDDEFSFDDSSFGSDPFASSSSTADSGLPPDPFASSQGSSSYDPLSPSPGSAFDDSTMGSDPFASPNSSPDSFASSQSMPPSSATMSADPFSSQGTSPDRPAQDPFARPMPPPQSDTSVGKNLAHEYMAKQSTPNPLSPNPITPSSPMQQPTAGSESEMISLKLDAIRSELSAVSQRLLRLEHLIEENNKKRGW